MNYPKFLKFSQAKLAAILLVLFYVSEAISKFSIVYLDGKSFLPRAIKFLVLLFLLFKIITPIKKFILPIILLLFFIIGQLFIYNGFNTEIIISFSKFLFPLFLFFYFNKYPQNQLTQNIFFQTFEWLLIINGFLIIGGFVLSQELLKTYEGPRFGYNGLIITSATSTYVYTIALFYFLIKLNHTFFKNYKVWLTIVCCILVGTKALYIALFGVLLIFLFYFSYLKKPHRKLVASILVIFSLSLIYIFFFQYGRFNEIRLQQGLFSSILSFRDDLLVGETLPYIKNNWKWPNYLFGGISDLSTRAQMGFIDVFYFWGIVGGIVYLYTYYKSYLNFDLNNWKIYPFLILIVIVFLSGNFFENASVAIYLLILKERLIYDSTFDKKSL
ncbi:hypothetical protein [Aequorivita vladivostokensis]|uniref:Uncharacterized protein n=1 Tax=Aequorivita vladivostokensis TaxID=171194 RepID=A0ABR5DIU0_9FLAO|nr:hypothetical protein [Aequorivita vladivostokensis]KJJ38669.1 hypothetical protein MB09_08265 [Aequorivita vladivostokensis]